MPLQATSGAASYDAFGGGVPSEPNYIESVFSCFLYTGNGSTQTITNGIDLSTKGGLVWLKGRSVSAVHTLVDTARGAGKTLFSDLTNAQATNNAVSAFNSNGFTMGDYNNTSPDTYASWTFRKQPKFFDVVTWTGTGSNRTIAHNLDSVPGCIIVKRTDTTADWTVYHRSLTSAAYSVPLTVYMPASTPTVWNSTAPTSTVFSVGTDATVNASGGTYVAYIYAHDAGGFGLLGTDNVISCGSFTTDGAGAATVNLGYEPQWILMKRTNDYDNWYLIDNMRGWLANSTSNCQLGLYANSSGAEAAGFNSALQLTSTGFNAKLNTSSPFIYIAIRRGPMKVPTSGTSVFNALSRTGTAATATVSTTILPDLVMSQARGGMYNVFYDRLRGAGATLSPNLGTDDESAVTNGITAFNNTSYTVGTDASQNRINWNTYTYANWLFSRAPSFFDEVCYTGTGVARTVTHNLGVVPELMIVKARTNLSGSTQRWRVYSATLGATKNLILELSQAESTFSGFWNNTAPTSTVFTVGTDPNVNWSADTYVAYLFSTCAGVSKVGSYTGNGSTQTIDCGFGAGGARFVLIKRTDSTGGWYVYDTARGMTVLTDPYLFLNTTAAQTATLGSVTTVSTGFALNSTILAAINVSGGTYIFLAIA